MLPFFGILHALRAHHGHACAHRHEHIGVVDGPSKGIGGVKRNQPFVSQCFTPLFRGLHVRSFRHGDVSHASHAIQHERSRPFEYPGRFLPLVHGHVHVSLDVQSFQEQSHRVLPPLSSPAGRFHRVGHQRACTCFFPSVRAEPVVRKHRVWRVVFLVVGEQPHPHARLFAQDVHQSGVFHHCAVSHVFRATTASFLLFDVVHEGVVLRRFGVESKGRRRHHPHLVGGLSALLRRGGVLEVFGCAQSHVHVQMAQEPHQFAVFRFDLHPTTHVSKGVHHLRSFWPRQSRRSDHPVVGVFLADLLAQRWRRRRGVSEQDHARKRRIRRQGPFGCGPGGARFLPGRRPTCRSGCPGGCTMEHQSSCCAQIHPSARHGRVAIPNASDVATATRPSARWKCAMAPDGVAPLCGWILPLSTGARPRCFLLSTPGFDRRESK
eukprot:scaffold1372_cov351-Pavlova_lutheri.AAC.15